MNAERNWQVLLVGGGSGTGKTVAAQQLARRFRVASSQADDFRLVLQGETTREQQPALHFFLSTPSVWSLPPEELCERLIAVANVVSHAIEVVVAHHLATPYPIIIEGDGIGPALAAQSRFAGAESEGLVRAVFLFEPAESEILANMLGRGRGFERVPTREQLTQARMSWLYGRWIKKQAEENSLPVVTTRPKHTLAKRIITELNGRRRSFTDRETEGGTW